MNIVFKKIDFAIKKRIVAQLVALCLLFLYKLYYIFKLLKKLVVWVWK